MFLLGVPGIEARSGDEKLRGSRTGRKTQASGGMLNTIFI